MYMREKSVVTVILWFLVIGAIISVSVAGGSFADPIALTFILAVAATFATRFIWNSTTQLEALLREQMQLQQQINNLQQQRVQAAAKPKREGNGNRVGQLLDYLDEDEIEDLRRRLKSWNDDGAASFEDLLEQRRRNQG